MMLIDILIAFGIGTIFGMVFGVLAMLLMIIVKDMDT